LEVRLDLSNQLTVDTTLALLIGELPLLHCNPPNPDQTLLVSAEPLSQYGLVKLK
jgi:hypothetical protein